MRALYKVKGNKTENMSGHSETGYIMAECEAEALRVFINNVSHHSYLKYLRVEFVVYESEIKQLIKKDNELPSGISME